jgi:hypothetical protein
MLTLQHMCCSLSHDVIIIHDRVASMLVFSGSAVPFLFCSGTDCQLAGLSSALLPGFASTEFEPASSGLASM